MINRRGNDPAGLCSDEYGQSLPCYQISYAIRGRQATFMTLLTIGQPQQPGFSISADEGRIAVTLGAHGSTSPWAIAKLSHRRPGTIQIRLPCQRSR